MAALHRNVARSILFRIRRFHCKRIFRRLTRSQVGGAKSNARAIPKFLSGLMGWAWTTISTSSTRSASGTSRKADPFTRKRLLDMAHKYDAKTGKPSEASRMIERPIPVPPDQIRP